MFLIEAAKAPDTLDRVLVSKATANRVNGVCGVDDDASIPQDLCRLRNQPWLRIPGMNFE